jgi:hypothetical protein
MAEILNITTDRVDDIPLLLAQRERMGVQPLLDADFPTHRNGVGLSLGTVIWLTPILSEAHHRLNQVDRAAGPPPRPERRPAGVLEVLRHDTPWHAFEGAFTQP